LDDSPLPDTGRRMTVEVGSAPRHAPGRKGGRPAWILNKSSICSIEHHSSAPLTSGS
jgi:hypothetical protein